MQSGDGHQELVADRMPEAVVDHLEAVEVEEEHREEAASAALGARAGALEAVEEEGAVRQAGERIVDLAVGDVGLRAGEAAGLAVLALSATPRASIQR